MGHHALACGSTYLGWGSYGSMKMEEREFGWLERQRVSRTPQEAYQYAREKCFKSDPPPSFYSFLGVLGF